MTFIFSTMLPFHAYPSYKRATGLGEALSELGHKVYIMALDCEENRTRINFEAPSCHPIFFNKSNAISEVLFKLHTIWYVKPDYVYTPTYEPRNLMGLRALFPNGTKLLQEINELNSSFKKKHKQIWNLVETLGLLESDCQVCASQKLLKYMQNKCVRLSIKRLTLYLPFAYPKYINQTSIKLTKPVRLIYFGSLYKDYGIFEILKALAILVNSGTNISLDFIGCGPDIDTLKKATIDANLQKNVNILGYMPEENINAFLSTADVFISPLHNTAQDWYRCPSKIYYYIACNKPIVTCKIGDAWDALQGYGFYYKPNDTASMACAIQAAISNSTFSYPKKFIESHSWLARAKTLIDFLLSNPSH